MKERNNNIKLLLVDDHALFRSACRQLIEESRKREMIEVVAEAENGKVALELLQSVAVDIVLLDLFMPVMDGIETLKAIKANHPSVKVIILSMHDDPTLITRVMELGADSYLTKNIEPGEIIHAIRQCYSKGFYFNDMMNLALLSKIRVKSDADLTAPWDVSLSRGELQFLNKISGNKQHSTLLITLLLLALLFVLWKIFSAAGLW